jgi:hypothetical protein
LANRETAKAGGITIISMMLAVSRLADGTQKAPMGRRYYEPVQLPVQWNRERKGASASFSYRDVEPWWE